MLSPAERKEKMKAVIRAASGNFLELYDFLIYVYFAVYIARAFFPADSEFVSLMLALGSDEREVILLLRQREAVAAFSAAAGFIAGSPFPVEPPAVNWRMKSSSGFELALFSWRLIPAFSLRMRLSSVSRTLPLP